jgi:hypothetical protein
MTDGEREADKRSEEDEQPADGAELSEDEEASEELVDQEPGSAAPGDSAW